jgi:hypothetical protein
MDEKAECNCPICSSSCDLMLPSNVITSLCVLGWRAMWDPELTAAHSGTGRMKKEGEGIHGELGEYSEQSSSF